MLNRLSLFEKKSKLFTCYAFSCSTLKDVQNDILATVIMCFALGTGKTHLTMSPSKIFMASGFRRIN